MGLDMYLTTNSRKLTKEVHKGSPYGDYITDHYRENGTVLYWRKANAIHRWFVDHVQNGEDDCGIYEVDYEDLCQLRDICKRIIDECYLVEGMVKNGERYIDGAWVPQYEDGMVMSHPETAEELLPTQSGFFFGSADYDQWYYDDIKWTYQELDRILGMLHAVNKGWYEVYRVKGEPDWNVRFYYHSSW